jgi:hypothetical protein
MPNHRQLCCNLDWAVWAIDFFHTAQSRAGSPSELSKDASVSKSNAGDNWQTPIRLLDVSLVPVDMKLSVNNYGKSQNQRFALPMSLSLIPKII